MLPESYFRGYFNSEELKYKKCISNDRDKKNVYVENIDGLTCYIKKYRSYGRRKIPIAFGLKKDPVVHYKYISKKLKKINIPHAKALATLLNKTSFFERESLYVTEKAGVHMHECGYNKELIQTFFDYFLIMLRNKIYPTDYNTDGALVNNEGELVLIDLDAYKIKLYRTKKFKKYVFIKFKNNFYKDFKEELREEFLDYKKMIDHNLKNVKKELNI